jgi:hypothetical protein
MKFEFFKKQSGKTKGALFLKQNKTSKTKSKFVLLASTKLTKTSIFFSFTFRMADTRKYPRLELEANKSFKLSNADAHRFLFFWKTSMTLQI